MGYSPRGHKELDTTERLTHTLLCYKNVSKMKYQLGTGFAEMGERIPVVVGELGCGNHGYSSALERVEGVPAARGTKERSPERGRPGEARGRGLRQPRTAGEAGRRPPVWGAFRALPNPGGAGSKGTLRPRAARLPAEGPLDSEQGSPRRGGKEPHPLQPSLSSKPATQHQGRG